MTPGSGFVLWQKRTGILATMLLVCALLALADALVGGLAGNRGLIELLPGSRFAISGPLPPRTDTIDEFVIDGQPADGSVRLVPRAIFSGFWFGGAMWRGAIEVAAEAREGTHLLTVRDRFGEKQNPALVFQVRVWPDAAARNAHAQSRLTRLTGQSPYVFAVGFLLCGLAAGAANFLCGRLWARHLRAARCGEIYRLRPGERGVEITCELAGTADLGPEATGIVYRASGERLGTARLIGCEPNDAVLLVEAGIQVRLGDVVCFPAESGRGPTERTPGERAA